MTYHEFQPAPALADLIECYWLFTVPANHPSERKMHVFPPDGSCSLVCFFSPAAAMQRLALAGPTTAIREIQIYPGTLTIGIRLMPSASGWFCPQSPASLLDQTIHLNQQNTQPWQTGLFEDMPKLLADPAVYLDQKLLALRKSKPFSVDPKIGSAVQLIKAHAGQLPVATVAQEVALSIRQLQRLFTAQTGLSVKKFSQIRRLRSAIIDLGVQRRPALEMVVDRGFTDMAHYYKSFRNLTGYNIEKFFDHIYGIEHHLN